MVVRFCVPVLFQNHRLCVNQRARCVPVIAISYVSGDVEPQPDNALTPQSSNIAITLACIGFDAGFRRRSANGVGSKRQRNRRNAFLCLGGQIFLYLCD